MSRSSTHRGYHIGKILQYRAALATEIRAGEIVPRLWHTAGTAHMSPQSLQFEL
jgi:hypothetical protein